MEWKSKIESKEKYWGPRTMTENYPEHFPGAVVDINLTDKLVFSDRLFVR